MGSGKGNYSRLSVLVGPWFQEPPQIPNSRCSRLLHKVAQYSQPSLSKDEKLAGLESHLYIKHKS